MLGSGVAVFGGLQRLRRGARCLLGPGLRSDAGGWGSARRACGSQPGGVVAIAASLGSLVCSPSRAPATAGTMGQCGITSSKTVLVFLNLIFWVSGGRRAGKRERGGRRSPGRPRRRCPRGLAGAAAANRGRGDGVLRKEGREVPPRPGRGLGRGGW